MSKESLRVVLEIIETMKEKSDALSDTTDTLPPLMSNLKIEKKTDDPPGRQQEEEYSSEYAESVLDLLHEPTLDFVKEVCDTEEERQRAMKSICRLFASLASEAARDREEFVASIPENPEEWTEEVWEYMDEKEQEEDMRNVAEQQLALQK